LATDQHLTSVAAAWLCSLLGAVLVARFFVWRKNRHALAAAARPPGILEGAAYLSLPEVGKELRDLWHAAVARQGDEPVDSLAVLELIACDGRFVGYRLLESSTREGCSAMLRDTMPLSGSHARRDPDAEMTPHIAATLEIAIEIAHGRGTPATSADVLDGLAVVPGSPAHTMLGRLGFVPCAAAREAWHRLQRGDKLFWQQHYERTLERFRRPMRAAAKVRSTREGTEGAPERDAGGSR
jgi:hypothetical protein